MSETPKSLTAIVHVKFNSKDPEKGWVDTGEVETISRILDRFSEMPLEDQKILMRFADYLNQFAGETRGQSPG